MDEPSIDEDPLLLPSGNRPLHALAGDIDSSSDSDGVESRFPVYTGRSRPDRTAAGSPPLASPGLGNRGTRHLRSLTPPGAEGIHLQWTLLRLNAHAQRPRRLGMQPIKNSVDVSNCSRRGPGAPHGGRPLSTLSKPFATLSKDDPLLELRSRRANRPYAPKIAYSASPSSEFHPIIPSWGRRTPGSREP